MIKKSNVLPGASPLNLDKSNFKKTAEYMTGNVYFSQDDSPSPLGRFKMTQLTGTKFRETLPLIQIDGNDRLQSKQQNNGPTMAHQPQIEEESYLSKQDVSKTHTFAEYQSNFISGTATVEEQATLTHNTIENPSRLSVHVKKTKREKDASFQGSYQQQQLPLKQLQQMQAQQQRSRQVDTSLKSIKLEPLMTESSEGDSKKVKRERKIMDQLNQSAFPEYHVKRENRSRLHTHEDDLVCNCVPDLQTMLKESVTLKDGWRKVLLPTLDMRKQKPPQEAPFGGKSLADSIVSLSTQAAKMNSKERVKRVNYEQSAYLQSLVKETNVNGRSSVRNMLDMFGSVENVQQRNSSQIESILPSIRASREGKSIEQVENDYQAKLINAHEHYLWQGKPLEGSPRRQKTTFRNSPGYIVYRSQKKPIKRIAEHYQDIQSPFSENQFMRALESKLVAKSVSPSNYDNGYGPKKIRLFNLQTAKDYRSTDRHSKAKVNGKILDKNNIFISLAKKGRTRGRLGQNLTASHTSTSPQHNLVNDYASAEESLRPSNSNLNLSLGRILLSQTKSPSMASLNSSASTNTLQESKSKIQFQVENSRDWAPKEIASRSQVYQNVLTQQTQVNEGPPSVPSTSHNEGNLVLSQAHMESFIKVSNMISENMTTLENNHVITARNDNKSTERLQTQMNVDVEMAEVSVANQGTQVMDMEEQVSPLPNFDQWADEVVKLAQQSQVTSSQFSASQQNFPQQQPQQQPQQVYGEVFQLNGLMGLVVNEPSKGNGVGGVVGNDHGSIGDSGQTTGRAAVNDYEMLRHSTLVDGNMPDIPPLNPRHQTVLLQKREIDTKSSTTTMLLSPIKTSKKKLFLPNESGQMQQNSERKDQAPSIRRQASNVDISEVYDDKNSMSSLKMRGATAIDFMQAEKMQIQELPDFNRSQLVINISKVSDVEGAARVYPYMPQGLSLQDFAEDAQKTLRKFTDQPINAPLPANQAVINKAINPFLAEAQKQSSKMVKILDPVIRKSTNQSKGVTKPINAQQQQPTPVQLGEVKERVTQELTEVLNRPSGEMPLIAKESEEDDGGLRSKATSSLRKSTVEFTEKEIQQHATLKNMVSLLENQRFSENSKKQPILVPQSSSLRKQETAFKPLRANIVIMPVEHPVRLNQVPSDSIQSGVVQLQPERKQVVSPKISKNNVANSRHQQHLQMVRNASNSSVKMASSTSAVAKEPPYKRHNHSVQRQQAKHSILSPANLPLSSQAKGEFQEAPLMQISQIISQNKYGMPTQKDTKKPGEQEKALNDIVHMMDKSGLVSPLSKISEQLHESNRVNTQIMFRSDDENTRMNIREESRAQLDREESALNSPSTKDNILGVTIPKLDSVYPPTGSIEATLRRSAERFSNKFNKMMILQPLKHRKATKNDVAMPPHRGQHQSKHNDSISTQRVGTIEHIMTKKKDYLISRNDSFEQVKNFTREAANNRKGSKLSNDLRHLEGYSPRNSNLNNSSLEIEIDTPLQGRSKFGDRNLSPAPRIRDSQDHGDKRSALVRNRSPQAGSKLVIKPSLPTTATNDGGGVRTIKLQDNASNSNIRVHHAMQVQTSLLSLDRDVSQTLVLPNTPEASTSKQLERDNQLNIESSSDQK